MRWILPLTALLALASARADDWPTYQHDNRRSGATKEALKFPLKLAWVHHARAPRPAWPPEAKADYYHKKYDLPERVTFDHAYHVVGAGGHVYFGSSADDSVYCLDADTGTVKWSYTTEGPVRLAPTVAGELVLFGSDDGHVYAVKSKDGALAWKRRIAPEDRQIPGNQRLICAWPVRTDVLVEGDNAYACAGIFPSQGVYQVTLNVKDGTEISRQTLKVTAQGYQERVFGKLMIGTGRDPRGSFVAQLEAGGKEPAKEAIARLKDYPYAFIRAGEVRIAGGDGRVAAFDASGKGIWEREVNGKAHSLAVLGDRLLAGTDTGAIYCFTPNGTDLKERRRGEPGDFIVPGDELSFERQYYSLKSGYCLWLAPLTREKLEALCNKTTCQIIIRKEEAFQVAGLRPFITDEFGRVVVQQGPLNKLPYTDMLFNLVVAVGAPTPRDEIMRVLRPGGVAVFSFDDKGIVRRPPLKGVGDWTHMYADPSNTSCSNDSLAGGQEMRLQWWGRPGPRGLIDRHHRTVPPVYKDGRLFVPGEDRVTAVDAYNGAILWERDFPNSRRVIALRDSSYLALSDLYLYVAAGHSCDALDPETGKTKRTYTIPPHIAGKYEWGYTAAVDGLLIGSGVKHGSIRREQKYENTVTITHWDFAPAVGSDFLFAYEAGSDKLAWQYRSAEGLILNPTITIGGGRVYFVESANPATMKATPAQVRLPELLGKGSTIVALDLKTGREVWRKPGNAIENIQHAIFGSYFQDVLLVVGSRNSGTNPKKDTVWFDLHAFDARTGEPLWSRAQDQKHPINGEHGEQDRHPAIVAGKVYCEPFAYDLKTGAPVEWKWPWAKNTRRGCGTLAASASCIYFRNDTAQSFDLQAGSAKPITTETRPGCWINVIPAGGLVLAPEASSGCTCNYSVQTSLALIPVAKKP